jgi:hypothetical protein
MLRKRENAEKKRRMVWKRGNAGKEENAGEKIEKF